MMTGSIVLIADNKALRERLQKAGRVMAILAEALAAHMELIKDQANKNSAKGDEYWAVYSQGIAATTTAMDFIKQDMAQYQRSRDTDAKI